MCALHVCVYVCAYIHRHVYTQMQRETQTYFYDKHIQTHTDIYTQTDKRIDIRMYPIDQTCGKMRVHDGEYNNP
jgi:hypothetical protein